MDMRMWMGNRGWDRTDGLDGERVTDPSVSSFANRVSSVCRRCVRLALLVCALALRCYSNNGGRHVRGSWTARAVAALSLRLCLPPLICDRDAKKQGDRARRSSCELNGVLGGWLDGSVWVGSALLKRKG